jgi:hypothetical protein
VFLGAAFSGSNSRGHESNANYCQCCAQMHGSDQSVSLVAGVQ